MSNSTFSSNQTGSISETAIELDMLKRNYNVLSPLVPARYDRLVQVGDKDFVRMQVKTARIDKRDKNLRISFDQTYTPEQIDYFAVYAPVNGKIYYIPVDDVPVGAKGFTIRLIPRKNKRVTASFWCEDYETFNI